MPAAGEENFHRVDEKPKHLQNDGLENRPGDTRLSFTRRQANALKQGSRGEVVCHVRASLLLCAAGRSAARSTNGEGRERSIGVDRSHFARGMRPKAFPLLRFEGMLTEPDTMSVVSKAEDGCIRSDWPPRLLVAVGCPGGVGSRGFQKKRDV